MAFNCKVFDKHGKLKKILSSNKILSGSTNDFLNQKSTKRALSSIRTMKDPKVLIGSKLKFHDKVCIVCKGIFHPRHKHTKYCTHECQQKFYREQGKLRKKIRLINGGKVASD
jgi:hypothetical protein